MVYCTLLAFNHVYLHYYSILWYGLGLWYGVKIIKEEEQEDEFKACVANCTVTQTSISAIQV